MAVAPASIAALADTKIGDLVRSPADLSDWLRHHLPILIGPSISSIDPPAVARSALLSIKGSQFSPVRSDNAVTISGAPALVLASTGDELRVLVPPAAVTGPVKVTVGTHTATSPQDLAITPYPAPNDDGPPLAFTGLGDGNPGDANAIGTLKVLVVLLQTQDKKPASVAAMRSTVDDRWKSVQTFYDQASFTRTKVQYDIAPGIATLDGNFTDFVQLAAPVQNIIPEQGDRIAAIAAKSAKDNGLDPGGYTMLCSVVFTDSGFVRAFANRDTTLFAYDNGKSGPDQIQISIPVPTAVNELWINESATWGRFAHEFGHNIVSAPTSSGDGTATLGEDVYSSDLVDPGAASAQDFELMGNHDTHPIFSGYHLEKLGFYQPANIKTLNWDRNPFSQSFDVIAHGLTENSTASRVHIVKIKVSDALTYYIEVRQRPGSTAQIFDDNIQTGASPALGGVIVTRVIAGEMNNNQQTRFITLMHDDRVQITGDVIEDPARTIRISIMDDNVQARPLVCRVKVEWAQTIADNPAGAFDLKVAPWDTSYQSPDIWVDRDPFGSFDNPLDAQGRPTGNGDQPRVNAINQFTARVHVSGATGASNVKLTFYAVSPPGVGDNGNWAPIAVNTIASIPANGFKDSFCNWVPVVGKHTCLKVFASPQLGEISGGNNSAQENVFDFVSPASSPGDPVFIRTAIRNPVDQRRAVHLSLRGLPRGWAAQVPHAWMWLDGKAEREIDVVIWPTSDVSAYGLGKEPGRFPDRAPVRLAGTILRDYDKLPAPNAAQSGSRYYPIGGTFYRVSVRKRASIRMEAVARDGVIVARGGAAPAQPDQRIFVEVLYPDGKTKQTAETKTVAGGAFDARIKIGRPATGSYRVQAFIFAATVLADAESNIVFVTV